MPLAGDETMIGGLFRYFWDIRAFMDIYTCYGGGKGGGGGSAPSPDPNIGLAAQKQADLASAEYEDFKTNVWPTMQAQSQSQLDMSNKVQQQQYDLTQKNSALADSYQQRMQNEFYPAQDKLVNEANSYNTQGNFERQAALAVGDVNAQSDITNKNNNMTMRSYGINPTSGSYQGQANANSVMQSATAAAASTKARTAAEQLGWAKSMDAIGLGQGLSGSQATSTGLALNAGNSSLAAGQIPMQNAQALGSSYAQGYGGAMQGWNNVGQLGVASYNGQISAYNSQQQANAQSSAGLGAGLGALGGGLMSGIGKAGSVAAFFSDIRTKENIELVGTALNGLPVYEYEYKQEFKDNNLAGHGRFRGHMAHEVEDVFPEAVFQTNSGYKAVDYSKVN